MPRLAIYEEQHKSANGPGDSRPTALQIIKDEALEGKWAGKVVLVTGCSPGGLGQETVKAIHATGADIYITGRDLNKSEEVAKDVLSDGKPGKVEVLKLDLGSLESVKQAAEEFLSRSNRLNVLINNAGIMACPKGKTQDGFETQFGTNHLGHFLLFHLLKPALLASSTADFNSRVISLSSLGHRTGTINFNDFHFNKTEYDPWKAYGQSKLANILFANEVERRYGSEGLHALSVHPGFIVTPLYKHMDSDVSEMPAEVNLLMKNAEQGAATSVWAAVAKDWEGKGGKYLENCSEAEPVTSPDFWAPGYSNEAYNPSTEKRLWIESLKAVGLKDDA